MAILTCTALLYTPPWKSWKSSKYLPPDYPLVIIQPCTYLINLIPTQKNLDNRTKEEIDVEKEVFSSVNKTLTEDEMLALVWNFVHSGVEPTASTLSYVFYELALHPEVQDKMVEELSALMEVT